jgi:DNA-binding MarR family transcriptional regulator
MSRTLPRTGGPTLSATIESITSNQRALSRLLGEILAEGGCREDQWRVMRALSAPGGAVMGELATRLVMPAASVTRTVDELVDTSLAYRLPSRDDKRRVAAHLSDLGRERLALLEGLLAAHAGELEAAVRRCLIP